jgi:hypothetical protein
MQSANGSGAAMAFLVQDTCTGELMVNPFLVDWLLGEVGCSMCSVGMARLRAMLGV